jgi:hypothetical protein
VLLDGAAVVRVHERAGHADQDRKQSQHRDAGESVLLAGTSPNIIATPSRAISSADGARFSSDTIQCTVSIAAMCSRSAPIELASSSTR